MAAEFELYKDKAGEYRWRLQANNNKIIAVGEGYRTKAGAQEGIRDVQRIASTAPGKRQDLITIRILTFRSPRIPGNVGPTAGSGFATAGRVSRCASHHDDENLPLVRARSISRESPGVFVGGPVGYPNRLAQTRSGRLARRRMIRSVGIGPAVPRRHMDTPLRVSCVMPTRDCLSRVAQAIWYFLRQDYSLRELIIVDDGNDCADEVIPNDTGIRRVRVQAPLYDAAKRNLGCELSGGEIIAHWDDDTWYSPHRITAQVSYLGRDDIDVSALGGVLHYQPLTGRLWRYHGPPGVAVGVPRAGLMYRRTYWHDHRFAESARDPVNAFVRSVPAVRVDICDRAGSRGESPRRQRNRPGQHSRPALAAMWPRRFGSTDATRSALLHRSPRLGLADVAAADTGADHVGRNVRRLRRLRKHGRVPRAGDGPQRRRRQRGAFPTSIAPGCPPSSEIWSSGPGPIGAASFSAMRGGARTSRSSGSTRNLFVKTAWETSRLPADWPARLNETAAVIVPSRFAARVFRESGVRVPVEVVHEGVDPQVYPLQSRRSSRHLPR